MGQRKKTLLKKTFLHLLLLILEICARILRRRKKCISMFKRCVALHLKYSIYNIFHQTHTLRRNVFNGITRQEAFRYTCSSLKLLKRNVTWLRLSSVMHVIRNLKRVSFQGCGKKYPATTPLQMQRTWKISDTAMNG